MNHAIDNGSYILEEAELEISDDSDGEYVEVEVEDLKDNEKEEEEIFELPESALTSDQPVVIKHNEVVDDFIRNFFKKMNMEESLATFQREWYSTERKTNFRDLSEEVADIKQKITQMEAEKKKWQNICDEVQQTWDRLKQERNYHRDGLNALKKEKEQLTADLRKMKKDQMKLEPALEELKKKFEQVNKERSLLRIERDKLMSEIQKLQNQSSDNTSD
ncbi:sperm-associated antigen 16 protein-like [Histomonas meleagridis]|uniref:sperm-associated antigen 16 protein-like n=1 Tax=Histomonas meleagridis TaxID=135588 RepID=UPI00355A25D5|nr:sperm-associated antigen 16 protein-like [Histomonas meleagridis]KAH0805754.1 sperm-associated antigen 16 protein-like [Histomonas meleagridis]